MYRPENIAAFGVKPDMPVCGNCEEYIWQKNRSGQWDRHIGQCRSYDDHPDVEARSFMIGALHALTAATECPCFAKMEPPQWPTDMAAERKDAEVVKDHAKIDLAVMAVKAKFEEAVRDKDRCCWEQLETEELVEMLRGHIAKFEERGSCNRHDAADLIGISIMLFHKCAEGDFKYFMEDSNG